jgi:hypothetical protein
MSRTTKDSELANLAKRQKALRRDYSGKSIILDEKPYTGQALAEMCARSISAEEAVQAAYREWRNAVARRDAIRDDSAPVFQSLQRFIQATRSKSSQAVAEFGFKPIDKPVKSAETKAAAVEKLRATRKARHTMGKRQKKEASLAAAPTNGGVVPKNGASGVTTGGAS